MMSSGNIHPGTLPLTQTSQALPGSLPPGALAPGSLTPSSVPAGGPSPIPPVSAAGGSIPGTPFSPATSFVGEPSWPNPAAAGSVSGTSQADTEDNDSLTLNQKNMLKVRSLISYIVLLQQISTPGIIHIRHQYLNYDMKTC